MSLVTGEITKHGAVIGVQVGVSLVRRQLLEKLKMPIPEPVQIFAVIDTGSDVSGFPFFVFEKLSLTPTVSVTIHTPSTTKIGCLTDQYDVSLTLISGSGGEYIPRILAIATLGDGTEEAPAIIGRDILNRYVFRYFGPSKQFDLSF